MLVKLKRSFDQHTWTFGDVRVSQLVLDPGSIRLIAWHLNGSADIRLFTPFEFVEPDGSKREVDPEQAEQVAPLLTLVQLSITGIEVTRAGSLQIAFGDGSSIGIEPHSKYEAWEANGEGALKELAYLCGPGGGSPWGSA